MENKNNIKKYYNSPNKYLQEHIHFFNNSNIKKDVLFLKKTLNLNKKDQILDIACGQGRHVNELASLNYNVTGIDFAKNLLKIAKEKSSNIENQPKYYLKDLSSFKLNKKYSKAYWFFSDLANLNPEIIIKNISKTLKKNGLLLLDFDNIFRLINTLNQKKYANLIFNTRKSILIDKENQAKIPYLTINEWENIFKKNKIKIIGVYGNYNLDEYSIKSPRMIIKLKKTV